MVAAAVPERRARAGSDRPQRSHLRRRRARDAGPRLGHGVPPRRPAVSSRRRRFGFRRGGDEVRGGRGDRRPAARPEASEPGPGGVRAAVRRQLAERQVVLGAVTILAIAVALAFTTRHDAPPPPGRPAADAARQLHGPRGGDGGVGARPPHELRRPRRRRDDGDRQPGAPVRRAPLPDLPPPPRARLGDRPGRRPRRRRSCSPHALARRLGITGVRRVRWAYAGAVAH